MNHVRTGFVVLGTILMLGITTAAENSGGYRGPDRNGIYPGRGLLRGWPEDGLKLLWKFEDLGDGWASATVAGDTVYCIGGAPDGRVFSLDIKTGSVNWAETYGREFTSGGARFRGTRSTATVVDGKVVFSSGKRDERSIYCHDAETGEQLWHVDGNRVFGGQQQGWGYNESPLVLDGEVFFTLRSKDDKCPPVAALDLETGETVWESDPAPGDLSAGDSSIGVAGAGESRYLVVHLWRAIRALDPETGETLWSLPVEAGTIMTPTANEGYLLAGKGPEGGATMFRLPDDRTKDPEQLWVRRGREDLNGISQAVILDGKVFAIGQAPAPDRQERRRPGFVLSWLCLDAETGDVLKSEPCLAEGSIVAAEGMVYIIEGGEHQWRNPRMSLLRPRMTATSLPGSSRLRWARRSCGSARRSRSAGCSSATARRCSATTCARKATAAVATERRCASSGLRLVAGSLMGRGCPSWLSPASCQTRAPGNSLALAIITGTNASASGGLLAPQHVCCEQEGHGRFMPPVPSL